MRTFAFAQPLDAEAVPGALVALGLDCLTDLGDLPKPGAKTAFAVVAVESAEVWQRLFAASSTGGADAPGSYGADTPWFHRVVWELGVLALSPDGRHLSVLAATTTD